MLSSILNSKVAIEVNIHIIRVFTNFRKFALTQKDILLQLAGLDLNRKGRKNKMPFNLPRAFFLATNQTLRFLRSSFPRPR